MIIEALIILTYGLIAVLTSPLKVPVMPEEVIEIVGTLFDYISDGMTILANYVHLPYLLSLFYLVVCFDTFVYLYKFIMWVLRKIPLLNIK